MNQQSHDVKVRRMEKRDLQQVLDLINKEGWEYDMSEIDRIHRIDPITSVVACSGDIVVGGITVVTIGGRCLIGHVVVREGWRRKGLGKIMIGSVLKDMESRGVDFIEVYSVIDAVNFYEKLGFQIIEELRTYVKRGLTEEDCAPLYAKRVRDLTLTDLPQIIALDCKVLGFDRGAILKNLMGDFPRQCKGLFDGKELTGFIMGRTNPIMDDAGPWTMADPNLEDGALLLRALFSAKRTGVRVIFGLPERNKMAQKILSNAGFKNEINQFRLVKSKSKAAEFSPGMMTMSAFELG
jgi:ribosomal protein S18 acetylase RimI-like enzyme